MYLRRLCTYHVSHKAFNSYLKATWHVNTRNKNKHIFSGVLLWKPRKANNFTEFVMNKKRFFEIIGSIR